MRIFTGRKLWDRDGVHFGECVVNSISVLVIFENFCDNIRGVAAGVDPIGDVMRWSPRL